ncbi:hypothetical protein U9M48_023385 [Paspalum notatum var. saurae]|uniref:Uncharacterized protein n=1 Tax=Paspalum notatum var. saurae TaxID=547442 RepID=A0AAQ3TLH2_PASNO
MHVCCSLFPLLLAGLEIREPARGPASPSPPDPPRPRALGGGSATTQRNSPPSHVLLPRALTAMLREAAAELSRGASTTATKIRKRCAADVSPSSSERQRRRKPRVKRSVRLVGRRMSEPSPWSSRHHRRADADAQSAASARKLVSALWQLNGSKGRGGGALVEEEEEEEAEVGWDAAAARRGSAEHRRSASLEFSKLTRRKSKASKDDGDRSWHHGHAHGQWFSDVMSNGGALEVHTCPQGGRTPARHGDRTAQAQDLYNSLTASNELVRVLANVLGPAGGLSPTAASVLAALRCELDAARSRARQLAKRPDDGEAAEARLRRQLAEEVRAWKSRHREKAAAAARLVASELDGERRSRRRAERVGKKLADALADAEASLRAATRELERERASRERLEKVCDELAGGVGVGAEEEELRREAATVLEELEKEREMLQLADELREERVRMKLAEARLQFEEKNAVVDRLRQELEDFLGTSRDRQEPPELVDDDDHRLQLVLASEFGVDGIDPVATLTDKRGQAENGEKADDGSEGSDIELNMDGNGWSYTNTSRETTARNAAASVHGSLSDRGGTECAAGASERRPDGMRDSFIGEQEWDDDGRSDGDRTSTKDLDEDAERYEAIKNLREQMLAGHGFVFLSQGEADADRDRRPQYGLASHIEDGGLCW